jgi:hypothetical protein
MDAPKKCENRRGRSLSTDPTHYDRDHVILRSDWTDENPDTVLSNLKQQSDHYNRHQRTVGTFLSDLQKEGLAATVSASGTEPSCAFSHPIFLRHKTEHWTHAQDD